MILLFILLNFLLFTFTIYFDIIVINLGDDVYE